MSIQGRLALLTLIAALISGSAQAFERVSDRARFLETVEGKALMLTRPFYLRSAIRVKVETDGDIIGEALGSPVTGDWQWRDGFFCRDLAWGKKDLGPNCQLVEVHGNSIRFTSDYGRGDFADFRIE